MFFSATAYPLTLILFPLELEQGPFRYALGSLGKNCDFRDAGRLGLKNMFHFSKVLAAKCVCRLLKTTNLLNSIIEHKYIALVLILEWV